ncbi:DUF6188 family protein [Couchioplanes caeruleus]|nr:DUF6188 family protein [Couchioplanes caeruleus]
MVADRDAERRPRQARSINPLVGRKLEYVRLGHAIVLSFTGGAQVWIETVAHLHGPDGGVEVDPGESSSDVVATLLGHVVRAARTHDDGGLLLTFAGGSQLSVGADPDVESWAITGPDGVLMVCLARGELAVWGDVTPSRRQ